MKGSRVSAAVPLLGMCLIGCPTSGVGDPCIPNDEFSSTYAGATEQGAQTEDRSFQCEDARLPGQPLSRSSVVPIWQPSWRFTIRRG